MPILKKYKNALYDTLTKVDKYNFEITESVENNIEILALFHSATSFEFQIKSSTIDYTSFQYKHSQFAPGNPFSKFLPSGNYASFSYVLDAFQNWLVNHLEPYIEEIESPDLLQAFIQGQRNLNIQDIDFNSTERFNNSEATILKQGLNEIKELIREQINFNNAEIELIGDRLLYLAENVDKQSKTDWKNISISTIISIIITLSLDTEKGKLLWDLFFNVINNLPKIGTEI